MEKTTFYRFLSEIKGFLKDLCEGPINAKPSKYLLERNFNRTKIINVLMKADILERTEKVKDSTDSDEKVAMYYLSFKVKKTDFERKMKKIFIKYFEKNLNECEGGCGGDGGAVGGADAGAAISGGDAATDGATTTQINMGHPDALFGGVIDREYFPVQGKGPKEKKKGNNTKPENILGKTVTAESTSAKKIYITQEQYNMLMEDGATSTCTVGAIGDYTAGGLVLKTSDGKEDPCAKSGTVKIKTWK